MESSGKMARQVAQGLSDIHEAGFVQGDFTLGNIVIDAEDDAKIIDINRRGCPVGWEPPELVDPITNGQKIGMMIGVKTDLFQLGMVLWAIAEQVDEPESIERPILLYEKSDETIPDWYREILEILLDDRPQRRPTAKDIVRMFDRNLPSSRYDDEYRRDERSLSPYRFGHEYNPEHAIDIHDLEELRRRREAESSHGLVSARSTHGDVPPSTADYQYASSGSYIVPRGRTSLRRRSSPLDRPVSSTTSVSHGTDGEPQWQHVCAEIRYASRSKEHSPAQSPNSLAEDTRSERAVPNRTPIPIQEVLPKPLLQQLADLEVSGSNLLSKKDASDVAAAPTAVTDRSVHFPDHPARSRVTQQDSGFDEELVKDLNDTAVNHDSAGLFSSQMDLPTTDDTAEPGRT